MAKPLKITPAAGGSSKPKIYDACFAPYCRNAAGADGLCLICRDLLSSRQRRRFDLARSFCRWLALKVVVRVSWCYRRRRGRN